jgi:hypothetical protein
MKILSNFVRVALFAAFATGASALLPAGGASEAQAQAYSHGGPRVHHRGVHRPMVGHRHVAPRRVHNFRPGVRHHYRPVVRHHHRPFVRYHAPRVRAVYVAPRRCVWRNRWVQTYHGPQLVKQRVCYRRW